MIFTVLFIEAKESILDNMYYIQDHIDAMKSVSFEYADKKSNPLPPIDLIKVYLPDLSTPLLIIADGEMHKITTRRVTEVVSFIEPS